MCIYIYIYIHIWYITQAHTVIFCITVSHAEFLTHSIHTSDGASNTCMVGCYTHDW